ncbi:MAG: zinc-binding dehydrogenase, partial [Myxococcales bacterium]|nr:zinc-binding dehydrogenase [Myxococcales bacterium]
FERSEVRVVLDRVFPLEDIAKAHAYVERGRSAGKVAISIAA